MTQDTAKQVFGLIVRVAGLYLLVTVGTFFFTSLTMSADMFSMFLDRALALGIGFVLLLRADWVVGKCYPSKGPDDAR
jgi:hypothetical protein